jgi:hypothetical protein
MPFIAISYHILPGHDDEIADIFSERSFTRADSPVLHDETGAVVGRNLGTALFIQHDRMARLVHFEGDPRHIGRHMSGQQGVQEAMRRLTPYLAASTETRTPEGFLAYFRNARMERLFEHEGTPRPGRYAALRYTIRADRTERIRAILAEVAGAPDARPGPIVAQAAFVSGEALFRMLQIDGDADEAIGYLAGSAAGRRAERLLAPHLAEPVTADLDDVDAVTARLRERRMRVLQELSIDRPPVRA